MKKIAKLILKLFGWKYISNPIPKKSVIAVFPHTSYMDGFWGLLVMLSLGINYRTLSAKWLFFFPMNLVMRYIMHASPVKGGTISSIRESINLFKKYDAVNLIICPEGQLKATDEWNFGFKYIAKKAGVAICFAIFDYKNKVITIINAIEPNDDITDEELKSRIRYYSSLCSASAKHKELYKLPK